MRRLLGTDRLTVRRWRDGSSRTAQHLFALTALADNLELGHLLSAGKAAQR